MAYSLSSSPALVRSPQTAAPLSGPIGSGRLIHADPVLRVLHKYETALVTLRKCSPGSDAIPALMEFAADLAIAVNQSKSVRVDSTIDDVATRIGRPRSTVTDWANAYGSSAGNQAPWAEKRGGTWMIDNARFEAWYHANQHKLDSRRRVPLAQPKREGAARAA